MNVAYNTGELFLPFEVEKMSSKPKANPCG